MSPCLTDHDMAALADDSLAPAVLQRYRIHLVSCSDCRKRLDSYVSSSMIKKQQLSYSAIQKGEREETAFDNLRRGLVDNPPASAGPQSASSGTGEHLDQAHTIGPYAIIGCLGVGGMGTVHLCHDSRLDRLVAIKTLHSDRTDPRSRRRFVREARAAAKLRHDNVVAIHNVADPDDATPYLEMQYITGESLRERLFRQKLLDPEMAATIAIDVGRGLSAAHAADLVHRDVKPGNIMLDAVDGRAKLMDFGLVRESTDGDALTREGLAPGTPEYMSPEQFTDPVGVDPRTDVYSLGITLYEMLTGAVPFRGANHEIMQQAIGEAPPSPRKLNARIPRDLATISLKALEKQRGLRYDSATEMADDLQRWHAGEPILARRVGLAGRFLRWWKRQPALAAVSTASAILAVAGISAVLWQWRRAEHNLAEFNRQRQLSAQFLAEANRQRRGHENQAAKAVAQSRNADEARRQLLSVALQSVLRQNTNPAHIERKFMQMLAISEKTTQSASKQTTDPASVASGHIWQGNLWREGHNYTDALTCYESALPILRKLVKNDPNSTDNRQRLAATLHWSGFVQQQLGERQGAMTAYREAERAFRQLRHRNPDSPNFSIDLIESLVAIGRLKSGSARGEALTSIGEAREILLELQAVFGESSDLGSQRSIIIAYRSVGDAFRFVGDSTTQITLYRTACNLSLAVLSDKPDSELIRTELAATQHQLGRLLLEQGKPQEAITELQIAVDQQQQRTPVTFFQPHPRVQQAVYLGDLSRAFRENGQYREAIKTAISRRSLVRSNAEMLYQTAAEIGRCLSLLSRSESAATADDVTDHAALAIEILQQAIDVGFYDEQRLRTDPALEKLREHSDYTRVLALKPRKVRRQQLFAKSQRSPSLRRRAPVQSHNKSRRSVHPQQIMPHRRALQRSQTNPAARGVLIAAPSSQ